MCRRHSKKICHPMDSPSNTTTKDTANPKANNKIPTTSPPHLRIQTPKAIPTHRRSKQRYHHRIIKLQQQHYKQHILQETLHIKTSEKQMELYTQKITSRRYGFCPNIRHSPFQNAINIRTFHNATSPLPLISNLAFHDLTNGKTVPPLARLALGLGFKFIHTPKFTQNNITATLSRLQRDLHLKTIFAGEDNTDFLQHPPKLYVKSTWNPPQQDIPPQLDDRMESFLENMKTLFKQKRSTSNLLPYQEQTLHALANNTTLLFPNSDKGLGPCAVTYDQYVHDSLTHLRDPTTYLQLSKEEALQRTSQLYSTISIWLETHRQHLDKMDIKYIQHHMTNNRHNPFGQFYLTYKIHKGMKNNRWPTRPVCSDVSSLPHGLGKWVDKTLQPIATTQLSYLKDSFALKDILTTIHLPSNALLFTCDAVSMYTNIQTKPALTLISAYLRTNEGTPFHHYHSDTIIEALEIVFQNNFLQFGDTYWQQISGTGMGISPAPPWATIFYALHEQQFLPEWTEHVILYKRFIDDVIGIWRPHPCPKQNEILWHKFQQRMQEWHGLQWEFTTPSTSCTFMDMTIAINNNTATTTIFEKAQNLYLYIPPTSAHPPGMIHGLIYGNILRIHRLCTHPHDIQSKSQEFFTRLTQQGYSPFKITPIFKQAHINALSFLSRRNYPHHQPNIPPQNKLFIHLQYHPQDPNPHKIHQLWNSCVSHPAQQTPLRHIKNLHGNKINIEHLTIAYSRPPNLGNLFSIRKISGRGMNVSSFIVD